MVFFKRIGSEIIKESNGRKFYKISPFVDRMKRVEYLGIADNSRHLQTFERRNDQNHFHLLSFSNWQYSSLDNELIIGENSNLSILLPTRIEFILDRCEFNDDTTPFITDDHFLNRTPKHS